MVRMIFMKMGKNLKGGFHKTIFFWLGAGIAGLGVFNTFILTDNVIKIENVSKDFFAPCPLRGFN
jgi:hypothetical protein